MNPSSYKMTIPGPKSRALLDFQRQHESTAITYPCHIPIAIKSARGSYIIDEDENTFIDCLTGAGVLTLGHNHPEVVAAVTAQLGQFCHGLDFPTRTKNEFIRLQLSMLPESIQGKMKIHFCGPTGSDAVEAGIKLAKANTGADELIAFRGSYHGCSHATLSVGSDTASKSMVRNRVPGVHFFPFESNSEFTKNAYGGAGASTYFKDALRDPKSGMGKIAAVIMELVQGEGGVNVADYHFVREIRRVTQERNIPLIVDEIQTGCGRTGTWFVFEQYDIEPDIILTSKGLSGIGLPVSIMIYNKRLDIWPQGAHIGTFRGNQLAFAAGCKAVEVILRDNILENTREIGQRLLTALSRCVDTYEFIADVRGVGLMIGVEIVNPRSGVPDRTIAKEVQKTALRNGLILELGGRADNVIRLLPPLNISWETADQTITVLRDTFASVSARMDELVAGTPFDYSI